MNELFFMYVPSRATGTRVDGDNLRIGDEHETMKTDEFLDRKLIQHNVAVHDKSLFRLEK